MAVSQNGWPVIDSNNLDKSPFPGTDVVPVPGIRKGDVATLLHWVGGEFNKRVQALYNPGCWGWNKAEVIPGSSIYSNHSSGTAIDLNAPSFPWKTRNMTPQQREECRKIVNQTEGVVAWGGDFTTFVDEMHFEVVGSAEQVSKIVKKLGGEMVTPKMVNYMFRTKLGRDVDPKQRNDLVEGLKSFDELEAWVESTPEYKEKVKLAKEGNFDPKSFVVYPFNNFVNSTKQDPVFEEVTEKLYRRK